MPFGKFAFAPGQLYHSNEVTVLLGDNWFVKTTVKHALEIVERRKKCECECGGIHRVLKAIYIGPCCKKNFCSFEENFLLSII